MSFSRRTTFDFSGNRIAQALASARERSRSILDLTVSNPTDVGLPYPASMLCEVLSRPVSLRYAPDPFGDVDARRAIARSMASRGIDVVESELMLTASTSEAYSFLFKILCDPGDEVLVPQPSYPLFEHLAAFDAVRLVPYDLVYEGRWVLDTDSVRRAISPSTRAIIVVSPNNPTGSYIKSDELGMLASLGLPIIGDEVFATYSITEDATRARSVLEAREVLTFSLSGLSKLTALPQMKAAWMAVGGPVREVDAALARLELLGDTYLSVSTPIQHAIPAFLGIQAPFERAIRERIRKNARTARAVFAAPSAVTPLHVEGGWTATVRLPRVIGEEEWVLRLIEEHGVSVQPGHFFDMRDEAFVMLSLLTPEWTFEEGVRRIAESVEQLTR